MDYRRSIDELNKRGRVPGLEAIRSLLDELGNPQDKLKVVHVAGTNGKGSVCTFLASIMTEAGLRAGRFISPTIGCYEERFQINARLIEPDTLQRLFDRVLGADRRRESRGERGATLFEIETAIAYMWFLESDVDLALVECGMGGLEDATNVIKKPALSVITSVSFDHMQYLGSRLEEIARQKAGIIKEGCPVLLALNPPEVCEVIRSEADKKGSFLKEIHENDFRPVRERYDGSEFLYGGRSYEISLPGSHQIENAVAALAAADLFFEEEGGYPEGRARDSVCRSALKKAVWPGRLELIGRNPLTFRDGAHNEGGAKALARFAEKHFTNRRIIYIMGILIDKEADKMIRALAPSAYRFYVFTPQNSRGLPAGRLAGIIRRQGKDAVIADEVNEAYKLARSEAAEDDVLFICGSLSFMEEMKIFD